MTSHAAAAGTLPTPAVWPDTGGGTKHVKHRHDVSVHGMCVWGREGLLGRVFLMEAQVVGLRKKQNKLTQQFSNIYGFSKSKKTRKSR